MAQVEWLSEQSGVWADATNWDPSPPAPSGDDVVIATTAEIETTFTFSSGNLSLNTLLSEETFLLSSGVLSIEDSATFSAPAGQTAYNQGGVNGGTLTGAGDVTILGPALWSRGTQAGSGTTIFEGPLALGGDANSWFPTIGTRRAESSRRVVIRGGADWTADSIWMVDGTRLENAAGSVFTTASGSLYRDTDGDTDTTDLPVFRNEGTLRKVRYEPDPRLTTTQIRAVLENTGTVEVNYGSLSFSEDVLQTAGTMLLDGGEIEILGGKTLRLEGGTLAGNGFLRRGAVVNTAGTLSPGTTPGSVGVINISGSYSEADNSRILIDIGGTNFSAYDRLFFGPDPSFFDGSVELNLLPGYTPAAGDSFSVLNYVDGSSTQGLSYSGLSISDLDARDDVVTTDEDSVLSIEVLTNDSDSLGFTPEAGPTTLTLTVGGGGRAITQVNGAAASEGAQLVLASGALLTLLDADAGTFSYDPNGAFEALGQGEAATDGFSYAITDSFGSTDTASVTIQIQGVDDEPPPVALEDEDESISIEQGSGTASGSLLTGTTSPNGPVSIAGFSIDGQSGPFILGSPTPISGVGELTIAADGAFSFTPAAGFTGTVPLITYRVTDGIAPEDTSTLSITVDPTSEPPPSGGNDPLIVTQSIDTGDTSAAGSLSWAIATANQQEGADTILLQSDVTLVSDSLLNWILPLIDSDILIGSDRNQDGNAGQNEEKATISGGGEHAIFFAKSGQLMLRNLELADGFARGGLNGAGMGGALFIYSGQASIENTLFTGNRALGGRAKYRVGYAEDSLVGMNISYDSARADNGTSWPNYPSYSQSKVGREGGLGEHGGFAIAGGLGGTGSRGSKTGGSGGAGGDGGFGAEGGRGGGGGIGSKFHGSGADGGDGGFGAAGGWGGPSGCAVDPQLDPEGFYPPGSLILHSYWEVECDRFEKNSGIFSRGKKGGTGDSGFGAGAENNPIEFFTRPSDEGDTLPTTYPGFGGGQHFSRARLTDAGAGVYIPGGIYDGGGAGMGGAIFIRSGTLTITNSSFSGNSVVGGRGGNPDSTLDDGQAFGSAIFALTQAAVDAHQGSRQGLDAPLPVVAWDESTTFAAGETTFTSGASNDGYIEGATVFVDVDGDLSVDPEEVATTTDAAGRFFLDLPIGSLDTNGNGRIDPEEAELVSLGGIDTSTNLPARLPMLAPAGSQAVTPLTTLQQLLIRRGLGAIEASELVLNGLNLPLVVNLGRIDPIAATFAGIPAAASLLAGQIAVQTTVGQITALLEGLAGDPLPPAADPALALEVFDALAERVLEPTPLDLTDPAALAALLPAVLARFPALDAAPISGHLSDLAGVIAAGNGQLVAALATPDPVALLQGLFRAQAVGQGFVTEELAAYAAGDRSLVDLLAGTTGAPLQERVANAPINDLPDFLFAQEAPSAAPLPDSGLIAAELGIEDVQGLPLDAEVQDLIRRAASLPDDLDLSTFRPLEAAAGGDPLGAEVYARLLALQTFLTQTAELLGTVLPDDPISALQTVVIGQLITFATDRLAQGLSVDLADPAQLDALFGAILEDLLRLDPGLDLQPISDSLDAITDRLAAGQATILAAAAGDPAAAIAAIERAQQLVEEGSPPEDVLPPPSGEGEEGQDTPAPLPPPFEPCPESTELTGDALDNLLEGTAVTDVIAGRAGDDTLRGLGCNDFLSGESGADFIGGNQGHDALFGGDDDDVLRGGREDDFLNGNAGSDFVSGDLGHDWLHGGRGNDSLNGNAGNDVLHGDRGADLFLLSRGNDRIADFSIRQGDRIGIVSGQEFTLQQSGADLLILRELGITTLADVDLAEFQAAGPIVLVEPLAV